MITAAVARCWRSLAPDVVEHNQMKNGKLVWHSAPVNRRETSCGGALNEDILAPRAEAPLTVSLYSQRCSRCRRDWGCCRLFPRPYTHTRSPRRHDTFRRNIQHWSRYRNTQPVSGTVVVFLLYRIANRPRFSSWLWDDADCLLSRLANDIAIPSRRCAAETPLCFVFEQSHAKLLLSYYLPVELSEGFYRASAYCCWRAILI